jgi:hypothetical protein
MVATEEKNGSPAVQIARAMHRLHGAWLVEAVDDLFHFTSRYQQFYVKLTGTSAVIYSYHETIALK